MILMLNQNNEEVDVPEEHFEAALKDKLEPAFEMKGKDGVVQVVRKSLLPQAQKDGLEFAVVADAKAKPVGLSKTDSFLRGVGQGGTLGFGDEIVGAVKGVTEKIKGNDYLPAYRAKRDEQRSLDKAAKDEHAGMYMGGEILGSVAVPLPGMTAAKGASLGVRAAKGAVTGALQSGISAVGASEANDVIGNVKDGLSGAKSGALFGAALPAVGAGLSAVKRIIPGTQNASKLANSSAQKAAEMLGLDTLHSSSYKEFLDNPELYEKARAGRDALRKNPEQYKNVAQDLVNALDKENAAVQQTLRNKAASSNMGDSSFGESVDSLKQLFTDEAVIAKEAGASKTYREGISDALRAFDGKDLESIRAAKSLEGAGLTEGNKLWMGRKLLDDKLAKLEKVNGSKASTEYRNLLELRARVDAKLKGKDSSLASASLYETADATHADTSNVQQELGNLFNAPGGDVKTSGAYRFFKNSAGDEQAIRTQDAMKQAKNLVESRFGSNENASRALSEFESALQGPQSAGKLAQLSGATGLTTGKSLIPLAVAGLGGFGGGIATGGLSAVGSTAATNPAVYLALINAYNRGEKKALELMGNPAVQEGLRRAQQAFPRMFGLSGAKPQE